MGKFLGLFLLLLLLAPSAQAQVIIDSVTSNGSFEARNVGTFDYIHADVPNTEDFWTYGPSSLMPPSPNAGNGSGISRNSGFVVAGGPADGAQFVFLQRPGSSISTTFNLAAPSNLSLTFALAGRTAPFNGVNTVQAFLDGTPIFATDLVTFTSMPFTDQSGMISGVAAGVHTLRIENTTAVDPTNSRTAYIDNVRLSASPVPEIDAGAGLLPLAVILGMLLLVYDRRRLA